MARTYLITENELLSAAVDDVDGHLKFTRDNGDVVDAGQVRVDVTPEVSAARDAAVAARDEAVTAADRAEAVGDTNDTIMTGVLRDPDSVFGGELSATIAGQVAGVPLPALITPNIKTPAAFHAGIEAGTTWETPDGGGVVVHPSVLYVPNGIDGYRWWAAATPYLNSDNQVENPCVYVSTDGVEWVEAPGVTNPLAGPPAGGYNSDTHLTQSADGRLLLYYREFVNPNERIRMFSSSDGVTWDGPVTVLPHNWTVRRLVSPAVWWDAAAREYVMIAVEILADPRVVLRFTAPAPEGPWTFDQEVDFDLPWRATYSPWHLDAHDIGGQVVAMIQDSVADGGGGAVYVAVSDDGGRTFRRAADPVRSGSSYRSALVPRITEQGLTLEAWFGDFAGAWGVKRATLAVPAASASGEIVYDSHAREASLAALGGYPYLFGDVFNRAASGLGVASSGQTWQAVTGTFNTQSGVAAPSADANSLAVINTGVADARIAALITEFSTQSNVVLRLVDGSNFVRFAQTAPGEFRLQVITAGAVAETLFTILRAATAPFIMDAHVVGNDYECYLNGELIGTGTTAAHAAGMRFGIQANRAATKFAHVFAARAT